MEIVLLLKDFKHHKVNGNPLEFGGYQSLEVEVSEIQMKPIELQQEECRYKAPF